MSQLNSTSAMNWWEFLFADSFSNSLEDKLRTIEKYYDRINNLAGESAAETLGVINKFLSQVEHERKVNWIKEGF